MRCIWTALVFMALSNSASADQCKIVWLDLFLPQSEAEFEKTSEVSALLTLENTGKLEPISFELALRNLVTEDGKGVDLLVGTQTLVAAGLSNEVTVTLDPKSTNWIVSFDSRGAIRAKDGRTFDSVTTLAGYLICNQHRPWP